jgi:hypothetical protein
MLPHQGYSRPENPKRQGFDSSIKLSALQNGYVSKRKLIWESGEKRAKEDRP